MSIVELLPWLNTLVLPGVFYLARLERRIMKLEIMLALHMGVDRVEINKAVT